MEYVSEGGLASAGRCGPVVVGDAEFIRPHGDCGGLRGVMQA